MTKPHAELKSRQRAEREGWPEFLALRVHRALSWLDRAERCEDDDERFVFLRVAFDTGRDGSAILGDIVPVLIEIMMDHPGELWGEPCYPVTPQGT